MLGMTVMLRITVLLSPFSLFFLFVVLLHHLNDDCKRDDERGIYVWCNVDGVAIAEDGELAANLRKHVAVIVTYCEIPTPYIAIDVEDHAITALNLEALAEQPELLMHGGPKLAVAINFIMWQKRKDALLFSLMCTSSCPL